jgi:hypothetical protein
MLVKMAQEGAVHALQFLKKITKFEIEKPMTNDNP